MSRDDGLAERSGVDGTDSGGGGGGGGGGAGGVDDAAADDDGGADESSPLLLAPPARGRSTARIGAGSVRRPFRRTGSARGSGAFGRDAPATADEATELAAPPGDGDYGTAEKVKEGAGVGGVGNVAVPSLEPADALTPLVSGPIVTMTNYVALPRPPSSVKSLPALAPYRRTARHRSFYLWWINEFRHWWKSSRLLVRMAGLGTHARDPFVWDKLIAVRPYVEPAPYVAPDVPVGTKKKVAKKIVKKAMSKAASKTAKARDKNANHFMKLMKKLGRGGPMHGFLVRVHPFTRSLRILVAAWRWIESAQCRREEVGVEEALAFIGNRVSRMIARSVVDLLSRWVVLPLSALIFHYGVLPESMWHPAMVLIVLGVIRGCAPYAASFQGSRVGRVLTREYYTSARHRWHPLQRVRHLNLGSDDCCEKDEVTENSDLAKLAKVVARALGTCQEIGIDGLEGQAEALEGEGFRQVGAGSGGYAVYECHRLAWGEGGGPEEAHTLLLHVTPYGPSVLDVLPRYIVLEREDSVVRRSRWSEFLSRSVWEGPPVLEGYCYLGAFFSPHHFAEMKETYDAQLVAYDVACRAMCKPRTGRNPGPPVDLAGLKGLLNEGKQGRKKRRNYREYTQIQRGVRRVAREMKGMMSVRNQSSRGADAWTARAREQAGGIASRLAGGMGGGVRGADGCRAPRGVILYFEGLDCAGKSSTGGLVQQALADAGYGVEVRIYNRPPTAEQRARPWMDRFEVPDTAAPTGGEGAAATDGEEGGGGGEARAGLGGCVDHAHAALVWDRGPAGDFVYGNLAEKSLDERMSLYREFMAFDRQCYENGILFCKLLFVTNRDSIASTLGKRLAQRRMSRDLRTWLKASRGGESAYGEEGFEGLDEIDLHIDPTDFVAFNLYQNNLHQFVNFALNTENEDNPWIVVNTTDRYRARKQLLRAFNVQLDRFKTRGSKKKCPSPCCRPKKGQDEEAPDTPGYDMAKMMERGFRRPLPVQAVFCAILILVLVWYYVINTKFDTFAWGSGESNSTEYDVGVVDAD